MSIRKRFILSHAAMIITPILVIMLIMLLVKAVLFTNMGWEFGQKNSSATEESTVLFQELIKTASLTSEKLMDQSFLKASASNNHPIIVRKDHQLIYSSKAAETVTNQQLPAFGTNAFNPAGIWTNTEHYSIKQHDFYFQDGTEGSVFLLNAGSSFAKSAKVFFPILFISLILTLILTNILLSYFMSKSILQPIQNISDGAEKISKGDFNFTLVAEGKDELSRLTRSFDSMRAQLKESLEMRKKYENNRKELIANISHDLKTPITSIMGYVEGLEKGVANSVEKRSQYLEIIHSKATYMNQLIEELALYSKLEVNRETFHFEKVPIKAFFEDYVEDIKGELYDKGISLSLTENIHQKMVLMDRNKIIRLLENIVYNCVKYGSDQILLSLTVQEEKVEVAISDNGPGVPEKDLATIFTRFYQGNPARSEGGSGLGLAIAKQIIEAHGGTIWAGRSRLGGLAVHFTLNKTEDDTHE